MAVVEESAVPEIVSPSTALVEVAVIRAVKVVETARVSLACDPGSADSPIFGVLTGVRMHDIQQDSQPQLVCPVNQTLELLGRSVSRTDGEERGDLVAKRGIVGVLHDGHHLDAVVAELGDSREDIVPELDVAADFGFRGRDADCQGSVPT